jgi:hypothetical protein
LDKQRLLKVAGLIWVVVGLFLIYRGSGLYNLAVIEQNTSKETLIISIIIGVVIGIIKGRFVLSKTALRNRNRINQLVPPLGIHQIFSGAFYCLIMGMMLLGFLLREFNDYLGGYVVVASIYCGIGMALIAASSVYWKNDQLSPPVKEVS